MHPEAPATVSLQLDKAAAALRRRWPTALLALVIWFGIGMVACSLAPTSRTATAAVTVESFAAASPTTGTPPAPDMPTEQQNVTSTAVLDQAGRALRVSASAVDGALTVANPAQSRVLTVSYTAASAAQAAQGANTVATTYLTVRRTAALAQAHAQTAVLQAQISLLRRDLPRPRKAPGALENADGQQLANLEAQVTDLALVDDASGGHVTRQATPASATSGPSLVIYLAGALVLGLASAVAVALLRDRMSRRASDPQLLSSRIGAPVVVANRHTSANDVLRTLALRLDLDARTATRTIAVAGTPTPALAHLLAERMGHQGLRTRLVQASDVSPLGVDRGWPTAKVGRVLIVDLGSDIDDPVAATVASRCDLVILVVTTKAPLAHTDAFLALLRAAGRQVTGAVLLDRQHPLCTAAEDGAMTTSPAGSSNPPADDALEQEGA
ncbi:hypothetical protein [Nocardioides sp. Iso805N]|uniref:hypothetical protein n=1 Tax=Nocardioides sp. Iso805N TaxID=1283287 RepID=UPI00036E175C|nr:hypothetical protein [Nocardioides sp. Iso805N]